MATFFSFFYHFTPIKVIKPLRRKGGGLLSLKKYEKKNKILLKSYNNKIIRINRKKERKIMIDIDLNF